MNSCILMAEVVENPQLRYTPDNQTPIAELWVEIPGLRDEDPAARVKVVGWGNLAQEIQERYHQGDRIIVEGRLGMNSVDRPEGFKEKRAELTVQRIHLIGAGATLTTTEAVAAPTATAASAAPAPGSTPKARNTNKPASRAPEPAKTPAYSTPSSGDPVDYDEIPF